MMSFATPTPYRTDLKRARAPVPLIRPPLGLATLALRAEVVHHNDPLIALVPVLRHLQPRELVPIGRELDRRDGSVLLRRDLIGLDVVVPVRRLRQGQNVDVFAGVPRKVQVRRLDGECDVVLRHRDGAVRVGLGGETSGVEQVDQ
jgi:hypothetical protein